MASVLHYIGTGTRVNTIELRMSVPFCEQVTSKTQKRVYRVSPKGILATALRSGNVKVWNVSNSILEPGNNGAESVGREIAARRTKIHAPTRGGPIDLNAAILTEVSGEIAPTASESLSTLPDLGFPPNRMKPIVRDSSDKSIFEFVYLTVRVKKNSLN